MTRYKLIFYSISHPNKYGVLVINLSNDPGAAVTLHSPTSVQLAIERVIRKTCTNYSIPLDISDKLQSTFKSKLWRMGKALAKLGGPKRFYYFKLQLSKCRKSCRSSKSWMKYSRQQHSAKKNAL